MNFPLHNRTFVLTGLVLLCSIAAWSQNFNYSAEGGAQLFRSSQDNLPFWMSANTNGAVGSETNYLFNAGFEGDYSFDNGIRVSGRYSFFYRDEVPDEFRLPQFARPGVKFSVPTQRWDLLT